MPSLVEKYSSLLGDLDMSDQEAENIAGFVADVTEAKLAGDEEAASIAFACYLGTLPHKVQFKLAKMIEYLDEEGGEQEKQAGVLDFIKGMGPVGKGLMAGAAGVGIPVAVGGALQAAGKLVDDAMARQGGKVLDTVIKQVPELKSDPQQTMANYATIQKFAPTLASDPNAVSGLMANLHQMGPGAITYNMLSQLAKMEADVQRPKSPGYFGEMARGMAGTLGGIGGSLAREMMN